MNTEDLPGFNPVEVATKIMIDFIFANGNKENTVDLFCIHDFQMAILYSGKTNELRSLFKYAAGRIIVIGVVFVKKTQKTPKEKIKLAKQRLKEV